MPNTLLDEALRLHRQGQIAAAASGYLRVLRAEPGNADALHLLGMARLQQGKGEEAERLIRKALKLSPRSALMHGNHGVVLRALKRYESAAASLRRAIDLRPDYAEAHANLGVVLSELGRPAEAIVSLQHGLALQPGSADAHNNLGGALVSLGRLDEAIVHFRHALQLKPAYADAYNNLGSALYQCQRFDEAVANYRLAIEIRPDYADAYYNLSTALNAMRLYGDALAALQRAMQLQPNRSSAFGRYADLLTVTCQWEGIDAVHREVVSRLRKGRATLSPFSFLPMSDAPDVQLQCARHYVHGLLPKRPFSALAPRQAYGHERLRVAYLSTDFYEQATAFLMAELFERHDRSRFEVSAFAFGPDDGSDMRRRLEQAFDRFVDVRDQSDAAVAKQMRDLEIDIAVDMKGHTRDARPLIFAHRPAPLQVNYLGFPATLGADFIDYILVDDFVAPFEQQRNFSEKLVHLPDCYQMNDSRRHIAEQVPSRADCGLPEDGIIFCCFNNSYKIMPAVFDIWMRLLQAVPGSVLWLLDDNPWASANLRREAALRHVPPERLVFAPRLRSAEHLARHRLADLFLDTLPVNAHTTASDALWAGLPLLTCSGRCFAARVAGSLLRAVGLPELVTTSLVDYEALALKLATEPGLLATIRAKLQSNRLSAPLFRTDRTCRHIEAAYGEMQAILARGEPPRGFAVPPQA